MAQRPINLGTPPRGTDGDTVRQANEKINANFAELYATKQDGIEGLTPAGIDFLQAGDAPAQREAIGLDQVNNTSDLNKPVSTAQQTALDGKVDKVAGKGLSENDFTDELYDKLSAIEGTHFRGQFISLEALQAAIPSANIGDYANIDPGEGQDVQRALWDSDDADWVISGSGGGQMTPAQIKSGLLANPDTNVLTDAQLQKLNDVQAGAEKNPDAAGLDEVQAGTGTALRSWSVLRVWQAIQAWWNASAMKTKLDSFPSMPPADGKTYALKDGQWVEAASGGAGGNLYDVQFYTGLRANLAAERPGFAFLDGQKALRSMWPDAFARIINYPIATEAAWAAGDKGKFTLGDGSTDFRLADWNGATGGKARVLRGGVAGTEGTFEEDAMQGHEHTQSAGNGGSAVQVIPRVTGANDTGTATPNTTKGIIADGANGTPRIANETRAASVKGAWIVRLSNAAGPVGQVDVQALASEVTALRTALTDAQSKLPKNFESAPLSWVAGGELTVSHNLGVVPKICECEVVFKVAANGFAIGERAKVNVTYVGATGSYGPEVRKGTATSINVKIGAQGLFTLNSAGTAAGLSAAQVDLIVKVLG